LWPPPRNNHILGDPATQNLSHMTWIATCYLAPGIVTFFVKPANRGGFTGGMRSHLYSGLKTFSMEADLMSFAVVIDENVDGWIQ
jgi:hypothetical protein